MKTAVIYLRVSTKVQAKKGYGLEIQSDECKAYAAQHGFEIVEVFIEPGVSGKTNKRPEFDRLKTMAGKVDAVILWVHSRFSRKEDVLETLTLMQAIEKAGTEIHTTSRGRVTTLTMEGLIMAVIDLHRAAEERKELIDKTRKGKRKSRQHGHIGATQKRYGYRYISKVENGGTQRLAVVEAEKDVINDIFTWFAVAGPNGEKLSTISIAYELTRRRVPTARDGDGTTRKKKERGVWGESTIRHILKNPLYKGVAVSGQTRVEWFEDEYGDPYFRDVPRPEEEWIYIQNESVPRLVEDELWNAAQRQFASIPARRAGNNNYLLRSLLKCPRCGNLFYGERITKGYTYYRCGGSNKNNCLDGETLTCRGGMPMAVLDNLVWEEVKKFVLAPDQLRKGQSTGKGKSATINALRKRQRSILDKIAEKQDEDTSINNMYQGKYITWDDYTQRKDAVKTAMEALKDDHDKISHQLEDAAVSDEEWRGVVDFCRQMAHEIEGITDGGKRKVLEALEITGSVDREQNVLILTGLIPTARLNLPILDGRKHVSATRKGSSSWATRNASV